MFLTRRSDQLEALRQVPLFRDLNKRQLDTIARHVEQVESKPGEVLVREGGLARELVLVVSGSVRVEKDGKLIAHRGAGEIIGEIAVLDGKGRSATVITDEPCALLILEASTFSRLMDEDPALQRKVLIALCTRIRELTDMVVG